MSILDDVSSMCYTVQSADNCVARAYIRLFIYGAEWSSARRREVPMWGLMGYSIAVWCYTRIRYFQGRSVDTATRPIYYIYLRCGFPPRIYQTAAQERYTHINSYNVCVCLSKRARVALWLCVLYRATEAMIIQWKFARAKASATYIYTRWGLLNKHGNCGALYAHPQVALVPTTTQREIQPPPPSMHQLYVLCQQRHRGGGRGGGEGNQWQNPSYK